MGNSILERQIRAGSARTTARGRAVGDTTSAWRAVGWTSRVLVVAGAVVSVLVTISWLAASPAALATGASLLVLVVAAFIDAVEHRLPNGLVLAAALPVAVALAVSAGGLLPGALAGAAWIGGPLLLAHLVSPAAMGFGDVKAGVALGAAIGLLAAPLAPLALVVGLAIGSVYGLARRARSIPLGPALVTGAIAALAVGAVVGVEVI